MAWNRQKVGKGHGADNDLLSSPSLQTKPRDLVSVFLVISLKAKNHNKAIVFSSQSPNAWDVTEFHLDEHSA